MRVTIEAGLAGLHQREWALKVDQAVTTNREERQLPTFLRAAQNMVVVAKLLDKLPAPFANGVGMVY
jgi:hypothetical protein